MSQALAAHDLVGRTTQRQQFAEWLNAAQRQQPVVVFVEAEAGVGKSSLVRWLADLAKKGPTVVLKGECIELGSAIYSYSALTEAIRLFDRENGEALKDLSEPGSPWATVSTLIADVDPVLSATAAMDPQKRILGAVLRMSDTIQPKLLVLIFEDLHWADSSTLDLVRYITKARSNQRLMLVCTYRPVSAKHALRALLDEPDFFRRVERMDLPPFTADELNELVTITAGWDPADARRSRVLELSEGNAFYAEQLVLANDQQSPGVEVPQSLWALMTARLDQLSTSAMEVARIAAVAGNRLDDRLLVAVSELDEQTLDAALSECIERRVLVENRADRTYRYQHALLRDVAYNRIRGWFRPGLHARIAQAMAAEAGTRLLPELAYHWFEAGRKPEALAAAARAAEAAVRRRGFPEAQAHYVRVLALWPDVPDAAELAGARLDGILGRAADAARWAGNVHQALEWVRRAMAEVDPAVDPGRAGELRERLGSYLWEAGEDTYPAYLEAERLLADQPASAVASRVQAALSGTLFRRGDHASGTHRAERAVELAREVGARTEEGRALCSLGLSLTFAGRIDDGEQALREALAIAIEVDHLEDMFRAYGTLGVCLEQGGRLYEAIETMTEGLGRAKDLGLLHTRQSDVLATNASAALLLLGRYEEGAELLDGVLRSRPVAESLYARLTRAEIHVARGEYAEAEQLLAETGREANPDPRFVGPLYGCIADSAAWQRQLEKADEVVTRGLAAVADTPSQRVVIQLCAIGLRIAADRGDPARADELLDAVRAVAEETDSGEIEWLTRQCYAEHARAHGTDTDAIWAEVTDGWDGLHQPLRHAYAQRWQSAAALRSGDRDAAQNAVRQAYATAEEIGAQPLQDSIRKYAETHGLRLGTDRPYNLTAAEMKVLLALLSGGTNQEMAKALFISQHTVAQHLKHIYPKMGVGTRGEAIVQAQKDNIAGR